MKFKTAEILCVGTEILIGDITNTNASFISRRLADMGISQYRQSVVGDNPERLRDAILESLSRCDLLIMTGGLGPTYDDLTKETAAKVMGRTLVPDEKSMKRIVEYFEKSGKEMCENNEKQAYMPEGCIIFENNNGTAPGCCIEDEELGKAIIMMPGPPNEMIPMWKESVEKYLADKTTVKMYSENVNLFGICESELEHMLLDLMLNSTNPTLAPYCKDGEVRVRVTASHQSLDECKKMCDEMVEKIKNSPVGKYVYGTDVDLVETLVNTLREKKLKIATAESCTGGMIASMITSVSGSSDVFDGSVVSYANRIKCDIIGVEESTLERFGAVSSAVARQMSEGIRQKIGADIGIGVTGIAGPTGGSDEKPVGVVFISISTPNNTSVKRCFFDGNRDKVRRLTAVNAIGLALEEIRSIK